MKIKLGAFDLLSEEISVVLSELGIEEETRPQEDAIPPILDGDNTLLIAPTGIGKTEAAFLPLLEKILRSDTGGFSLLYITPLKALNRDMIARMKEFSERLDFDVGVRHGDTSRKERRKQAEDPPDVLVTTPETLQIMFTGSKLRKGLENVRYVVVDELNELAEDERGTQLSLALERLTELCERDFQRIGLSATVGSPRKVKDFLVGVDRDAVIIETTGKRELDVRVERARVNKDRDKELSDVMRCDIRKAASLRLCKGFIEDHESTLFFVNTRDAAETLSSSYTLWREEYPDEDFPIGVHHGSLSKEARIDMEESFKEGKLKGLICTSSMELGIDVGRTDLVLQYQSPRQVTRLIQRVGRSGHRIDEVSKGRIISTTKDDIAEAAVIAEKGKKRDLERTEIPEEPLSVLANQLISTVHTEKELDPDGFFTLAKRAYPFRDLEKDLYEDLLEQLAEIKVIWKDEEKGKIGKRRASLDYFYDNISMIPDEKTYLIRDVSGRGVIGSLDESFVASNIEEGEVITLQGKAWRIVELEEEEVMVEQVGNIGKIPDWTGEDIPVPFEVAQEVGRLRREGWEGRFEEIPVSEEGRDTFSRYLRDQEGWDTATDDKIVIEVEKETAVVNACFGTQINETLGHLFASLLSARVGESVALQTDPYRIMMDLPRRISPEKIEEVLHDTETETLSELLKKVLERSNFFKWKFLHVGKKFGAIEKDADWRKINMDRIIDTFKGTVLYDEAVNKTLRDNMDIQGTKKVLNKIKRGEIEVVFSEKGISPMGEAGLEKHKQFLTPDRVSKAILDSFKERLESEKMIMKCLRCGNRRRKRIEDIDKPNCPNCGSSMVAPLHPYQEEEIVDKENEKMDEEEKKELKKYYKLADLARVYKNRAVMALAARGVGHQKAGRILSKRHKDEDDFLKDLLEAEIQYARTKRFWD
ncbi:MAG: DEAD/DEAH box helicase [Candidatus Thermoplasmatota archaeon]|nr:DEAD/DEAH box helicase [Candidatus Thermoplasmatota archaeon]